MFCLFDLSKIVTYQWYPWNILPYFGEDNVELHFVDTNSVVHSFTQLKSSINDLEHFTQDLDLSDLDPKQEMFSEKNFKKIRQSETGIFSRY